MDHEGQSGTDEALTEDVARSGTARVLAAVNSMPDLVRWRDELVRLERTRPGADRALPLGDDHAAVTAWKSLLAAGIARARDNGELAPDADPDRLATAVLAAVRGGLLLARTTRDVGHLETALDMALCYVRGHAVTRRGTT